MKLEFLVHINEFEEHAIRLSDFNSEQARQFKNIIDGFISDHSTAIEIADLDFIEAVNCRLLLRMSEEDFGIRTNDVSQFYCDLTIDAYKNMSRLLEPFGRKESKGYEWLYDLDIPIGLLFSAGSM